MPSARPWGRCCLPSLFYRLHGAGARCRAVGSGGEPVGGRAGGALRRPGVPAGGVLGSGCRCRTLSAPSPGPQRLVLAPGVARSPRAAPGLLLPRPTEPGGSGPAPHTLGRVRERFMDRDRPLELWVRSVGGASRSWSGFGYILFDSSGMLALLSWEEATCGVSPGVAAPRCCSGNSSDRRLFLQVHTVSGFWGHKQQFLWEKPPGTWLLLKRQDGWGSALKQVESWCPECGLCGTWVQALTPAEFGVLSVPFDVLL